MLERIRGKESFESKEIGNLYEKVLLKVEQVRSIG